MSFQTCRLREFRLVFQECHVRNVQKTNFRVNGGVQVAARLSTELDHVHYRTLMLFNNWCSSQFKSTVGNGYTFQVMKEDIVFTECIGVTLVVACQDAKSNIKEVELPQDTFSRLQEMLRVM